jgi:hypothetical protein
MMMTIKKLLSLFTPVAPQPHSPDGRVQHEEVLGFEPDDTAPRAHHYIFAHHLMPQWYFEDPEGFLGAVTQPDGTRSLSKEWARYGMQLREKGQEVLTPQGLQVRATSIHGRLAALVQLPLPLRPPEAYFVALVAPQPGQDEARYFIVERMDPTHLTGTQEGDILKGKELAVLCEWLPGKARRSHDWIMIPSAEAFLGAVQAQLKVEAARRAASKRSVLAAA